MHIDNEPQLDFSQVMFKPKRSTLESRADVSLVRTFKGRWNPNFTFKAIPIVAANMDSITSWKMTKQLLDNYMMVAMNKFMSLDEWRNHDKLHCTNLGYTIGIRNEEELVNFNQFQYESTIDNNILYVDVPNGYTERFGTFISTIRELHPDIFIVAGNVVSASAVEELILKGADCVKVGIGPGSCCKTRIKTGVGRPQFSAVVECADAAHGLGGYIIADGGCTCPGDIAKAFGAGADFVMIGSMLAGHDECDGNIIDKYELSHYTNSEKAYYTPKYNLKKYKQFWGMSSNVAMKKHYGEKATYRASEGRVVEVPYRGPVQNTIDDILGGLRSTCTYIGAKTIKDIPKCASFYIVNNQVSNPFKNIGE